MDEGGTGVGGDGISWLEGMLETDGDPITILRTPSVTSYVSIKRTSRSSDPANRALHEGHVLTSSSLQSGELFTLGADSYLVQSVDRDEEADYWFAMKCNATVTNQRPTETTDADGNLVQSWTTLASNEKAWGQIVTAKLRAEDPGLVDAARYVFQMRKALGVVEMDRIVYSGANYRVESVDDIAMEGVVRVQLSIDTRP